MIKIITAKYCRRKVIKDILSDIKYYATHGYCGCSTNVVNKDNIKQIREELESRGFYTQSYGTPDSYGLKIYL